MVYTAWYKPSYLIRPQSVTYRSVNHAGQADISNWFKLSRSRNLYSRKCLHQVQIFVNIEDSLR